MSRRTSDLNQRYLRGAYGVPTAWLRCGPREHPKCPDSGHLAAISAQAIDCEAVAEPAMLSAWNPANHGQLPRHLAAHPDHEPPLTRPKEHPLPLQEGMCLAARGHSCPQRLASARQATDLRLACRREWLRTGMSARRAKQKPKGERTPRNGHCAHCPP